jgi:hypothetical protein
MIPSYLKIVGEDKARQVFICVNKDHNVSKRKQTSEFSEIVFITDKNDHPYGYIEYFQGEIDYYQGVTVVGFYGNDVYSIKD